MNNHSASRRNYNPPNFIDKRYLQQQLDQQVMQFISNGGKIQKIPTGLCVGHSRITRSSRQVNSAIEIGTGDANG